MKAKPIPDNYPNLTAYIIIDGAAKAIEFYQDIFGAKERMRIGMPGGLVGHAELVIGNGLLMVSDAFPEMGAYAPEKGAKMPMMLHLYVEDVDTVFARAIAAGAKSTHPVETKFYGDRSGGFIDPFGHQWYVCTHVEDVSPEEVQRRAAAMHQK